MAAQRYDVAIVGGGIVGLATALAIVESGRASVVVLEAEAHLAAHQTGHNSGVIHSGLYYRPGSAKARHCVEGRAALYRFCAEHTIAHERCGKLVVATHAGELPALAELEQRGHANGLSGLRRLDAAELRDFEPHAVGVAALHVPDTGIVDYAAVTRVMADLVRAAGGDVLTGARLIGCHSERDRLVLETEGGDITARALVNCAGLQSDRVARLCGLEPRLHIVPFRGEYWSLVPERRRLVRNLIYPVPDPRYPFLGVHFTRHLDGSVSVGPNAVLAFKRAGYGRFSLDASDAWDTLTYAGTWHLVRAHWRAGVGELHRKLSRRALVQALQALVPELVGADIVPAGVGVRAQAVDPSGALVDDFRIIEAPRMVHVLNAPSPAATASLSIGREIARLALRQLADG